MLMCPATTLQIACVNSMKQILARQKGTISGMAEDQILKLLKTIEAVLHSKKIEY